MGSWHQTQSTTSGRQYIRRIEQNDHACTHHGDVRRSVQEAHRRLLEGELLITACRRLERKLGNHQLDIFASCSVSGRATGNIYAHLVLGEPVVCVLDVRLELCKAVSVPVDVDVVKVALPIPIVSACYGYLEIIAYPSSASRDKCGRPVQTLPCICTRRYRWNRLL